jgi:hypothetical protein
MTQSANRYTSDVSATRTGITDSNKRVIKHPDYKSNKRSANRDPKNIANEPSNRRSSDIFNGKLMKLTYIDGLTSSINMLKKRYESAHKHKTQRASLLPEMSNKNIKSYFGDGSHSKSRKMLIKKRGSIKKINDYKILTKVNSQTEYGINTKNEANQMSLTQLQKGKLLDRNISYNVKSSSNLRKIDDKLIQYSESYYKNKTKRSISQSSHSKGREKKYGSHNKTQVNTGIGNLSVHSKQSKV